MFLEIYSLVITVITIALLFALAEMKRRMRISNSLLGKLSRK